MLLITFNLYIVIYKIWNIQMKSDYTKLTAKMQKISHISNALGILSWDNSTYMPRKSGSARAEDMAALSTISHNILTEPETKDLIEASKEESSDLNEWEKANLREIEKNYIHASALDEELVSRSSITSSESEMAWRDARKNNDFKLYASHLEKVVKITREIADIKSQKLSLKPYDALIDSFAPGLCEDDIETVFNKLKLKLPSLITKVMEKQKSENPILLDSIFSVDKQQKVGLKIMEKMGFNFEQGRLDISVHPFCGGNPHDIRITTRYDEKDPLKSLMGIIHETGHALYEMNLPIDYKNQPVGRALGMAVHESQSLIMEMQVSRGRFFTDIISEAMISEFGNMSALKPDNLYKLINKVDRSLIRVDADEVTYPMHVILRFEIEKALMSGDLKVADLPEIWRQKMKEYLGIEVPNDSNGCMQDIHWPAGIFGYFPSYSYGAMIAAQLFESAKNSNPNIIPNLGKGDFTSINEFLNNKLRSKASLNNFNDTMVHATGEKLDPQIFLNYLEKKYM